MKILYVACGGFGDASWSTSWPRIWSENGHEVDVFLMKYTGNPFHANPFIKNIFIKEYLEAYKEIIPIIDRNSYDIIIIPYSTVEGMKDIIGITSNRKNRHLFRGCSKCQTISGLEIPPLKKPEWYFTKEELGYIEKLNIKNPILFHPLSSDVKEKSRNIDFDLIIEFSKKRYPIMVVYGGRKYIPMDDLKRLEGAGIQLLWEDYNCFNDESGDVIGKFLALTSLCKVSIHAWSGSFTLPMGYNKPYIMIVPKNELKSNASSPYKVTKDLYEFGVNRANDYGCLNYSAWCITTRVSDIENAMDIVLSGKSGIFNKKWRLL